ncbi:MAG: RecX family transcriptional regulator, partial [Firmicutes bacterium]|nr:RecX family transcriptional regulator [Bacillota bacterium]
LLDNISKIWYNIGNMAMITELSMQVKNKKRVNLYLDGRFFCGLEAITVLSHNLQIGQEIEQQRLEQICEESETSVAFDKAISYLGFRMHSAFEIQEHLSKKGYLPTVVAVVLQKLKDYKYVDDLQFATLFVESYKKKFGAYRIQHLLLQKGVSESIIGQVMGDLDSEDVLQNLIQKKYKGDKRKLIDFLIRRGFEYDDILPKVEHFLSHLDEDSREEA